MLNAVSRATRERWASMAYAASTALPSSYESTFSRYLSTEPSTSGGSSGGAAPEQPGSSTGPGNIRRPREGPVRFANVPKTILPRDLTEMLYTAGLSDADQRNEVYFEYEFRGAGVPSLKAAWYNPGGGPMGAERRQKALKLADSILSSQQISAGSFSMADFIERTKHSNLLRRSLWIDVLPDRFYAADLALMFQKYDLQPQDPVVVRPKASFGFKVPEDVRVGIVRFRTMEEQMLAYREMLPALQGLSTAQASHVRVLLLH